MIRTNQRVAFTPHHWQGSVVVYFGTQILRRHQRYEYSAVVELRV